LKQGEAIIRPSSKSPNHLTVTWKVTDDIFHHITVEEKEKQRPFEIGKKLFINGEVKLKLLFYANENSPIIYKIIL
jgi:transcription elongation factor SPT6